MTSCNNLTTWATNFKALLHFLKTHFWINLNTFGGEMVSPYLPPRRILIFVSIFAGSTTFFYSCRGVPWVNSTLSDRNIRHNERWTIEYSLSISSNCIRARRSQEIAQLFSIFMSASITLQMLHFTMTICRKWKDKVPQVKVRSCCETI